jgi:hypothetical protein
MGNVCCLRVSVGTFVDFLTWKVHFVPSRSSRIRIFIETCVSEPLPSNGLIRLSGVMLKYTHTDHVHSTAVLSELQIYVLDEGMLDCKNKWRDHVVSRLTKKVKH